MTYPWMQGQPVGWPMPVKCRGRIHEYHAPKLAVHTLSDTPWDCTLLWLESTHCPMRLGTVVLNGSSSPHDTHNITHPSTQQAKLQTMLVCARSTHFQRRPGIAPLYGLGRRHRTNNILHPPTQQTDQCGCVQGPHTFRVALGLHRFMA